MAGNPPEDRSANSNRAPGFKYTGATFMQMNEKSGHMSPMWTGELHGEWEGENDPAHEMAAQLGYTRHEDGSNSFANHLTLSAPHPDMPGQMITKHVPLTRWHRNAIETRERMKNKEKQQ